MYVGVFWGVVVYVCFLEGFWAFYVWKLFSEEKCMLLPLKFLDVFMVWWASTCMIWILTPFAHSESTGPSLVFDHCTLLFHFFLLIPFPLATMVYFELVYTLLVGVVLGFSCAYSNLEIILVIAALICAWFHSQTSSISYLCILEFTTENYLSLHEYLCASFHILWSLKLIFCNHIMGLI